MKQLPDILTSATFWASIATMWAASGAWFTYVAAAVASRPQTYEGILNLIEGLEAELALVSEWAAGNEGNALRRYRRAVAQILRRLSRALRGRGTAATVLETSGRTGFSISNPGGTPAGAWV